MKRLCIFPALALFANICPAEPNRPFTADELVELAFSDNPELRFYEKQVAALPKMASNEAPIIPQPVDFPAREVFRRAVLNLDAALARLYLLEFRFALGAEVRLKAMEYQAATEIATTAADLASRISALVKMLDERPAAGVESLIERRILEGASVPFMRKAAEAASQAEQLRIELNGLLGRDLGTELNVAASLASPLEAGFENTGTPLLLKIREAEIARGLVGLEAANEIEAFDVGGWFTKEGLGAFEAAEGLTRPGPTSGGTRDEARARLLSDSDIKITRQTTRRRFALAAAREVAEAIPPKLIENLRTASELAERQYRVGALGVNLLIEADREYLEGLEARSESIIQAWRNALDLKLLILPAEAASGK